MDLLIVRLIKFGMYGFIDAQIRLLAYGCICCWMDLFNFEWMDLLTNEWIN